MVESAYDEPAADTNTGQEHAAALSLWVGLGALAQVLDRATSLLGRLNVAFPHDLPVLGASGLWRDGTLVLDRGQDRGRFSCWVAWRVGWFWVWSCGLCKDKRVGHLVGAHVEGVSLGQVLGQFVGR